MGIFTWTDAAFKNPRCNKYGDYTDTYVVLYGGYAKLICPDDTEIETNCHDYYGVIGGHDIYELVAEWNRPYLSEDLLVKKPDDPSGYGGMFEFEKENLRKKGKTEDEIQALGHKHQMKVFNNAVARWENTAALLKEYKNGVSEKILSDKYGKEWKREIGIAISCDDDSARKLKYPIKLTKRRDIHGYNNLYISYVTQ